MKIKYTLGVIYSLLLLIGCSVKQTNRYDYTYLYDAEQKVIKPSFKVFHHNQDSSTLFFELESENILFGKLANDSTLTARILCKYKVYQAESNAILDSSTLAFHSYGENSSLNKLQASFTFPLASGDLYPMEIRFRDQYRDLNVVYYLWLDKRDNGNEQYYLLRNGEDILMEMQANKVDDLMLEKSPLLADGLYQLNYSNTQYKMTPPPFADASDSKPLTVDSSEQLIFVNNKLQLKQWSSVNQLICKGEENYLPFYFYDYYPAFPEISELSQMVEPLRYITTSKEYEQLNKAVNLKQEIDNFWLKIGGSTEKAEKMLRLYYKRVEMANKKFTSYKEGWKTDRGIIFIVYGQPTSIYKGLNTETWIYGEENHILSIKFEFNRKADARTNNHFELVRNPDYKNNWYRAVDMWRQGKIY